MTAAHKGWLCNNMVAYAEGEGRCWCFWLRVVVWLSSVFEGPAFVGVGSVTTP